jgi:hypothetical protein
MRRFTGGVRIGGHFIKLTKGLVDKERDALRLDALLLANKAMVE